MEKTNSVGLLCSRIFLVGKKIYWGHVTLARWRHFLPTWGLFSAGIMSLFGGLKMLYLVLRI